MSTYVLVWVLETLRSVFTNLLRVQFDVGKALKRALGGGISGAAAMFLQVLLLMVRVPALVTVAVRGQETDQKQPLRTIMNYQYRYGSTFTGASKTLYEEGGYGRYYQGIGAALVQGMHV